MAEYIMKDLVRRAGAENQISIRSAATSAEELGNPVYLPARQTLTRHGVPDVYKRQILTVILALFILFNQVFTMLTLPFVFGMWLGCTGITRFVNSFDLQRAGVRGWGWFTVLGLLLIAAGVISFLDPVAGAVALGAVLGVTLILEGVASILRACFAGRFWM